MSPSPTPRSSKPRPAKPEERQRRPGPGRPPKPVVDYPGPLWERVEAPRDFAAAFDAEIRRHGDSVWGLQKATTAKGGTVDRTTLGAWRRGTKGPQTPASLQVVDLIEDRYRLPRGYLRSRVTHGRAVSGPVGEYLKITREILLRMPHAGRYPRAAAESVRAFLMIRLGLHLGLRQKNLRQLLVRLRGQTHTSERELERLKRGELRWSDRDAGWEVFIPCAAFKNAHSGYFAKRPFRLLLPDLGDLYRWIDDYLDRHRARLLAGAPDPGVFFIKTVKTRSRDAAYSQQTFYEAWRLTIQRYGIHNPYTGRGAIAGLLPHGPHSVRDVLATHILKQTGSYEQASYAIQDTAATVADHYGRFLPQDKAALAAQVLNQVWNDRAA